MANQDQVGLLLLGVDAWNEWREKALDPQPDLSGVALPEADLALVNLGGCMLRGADLHGADLTGADLNGADLGRANLRGAILRGADLNWAFLRDADLRAADLAEAQLGDANLEGADLSMADLSGADLQGTNLRGVNLFGSSLPGANLHEAKVGYTRFGDVDLSGVKSLLSIKHEAPSTIGIDTLYRSKGGIPEPFLRGAGVPEPFIRYVSSLPQKHGRTYSCFICHSYKDRRFCDRLHNDLQAYGVRTWYVPEDAPRPKKFVAEFVVRTRVFDKVIAVCSKYSLETAAVLQEIDDALRREYTNRESILYPVRLDNYMLKEWQHTRKADVIDRVVADFRGWSRSAHKYDEAFQKLLEALKAS